LLDMQIPLYQVDAFANELFRGNPAAVCPLERWLPDPVLLSVAAENNLSETAFYVARPDGKYDLRWFTPKVEVELCGHATLATAAVILEIRRETAASRVVFAAKSGELAVDRTGDRYTLDFPSRPPEKVTSKVDFKGALGAEPQEILGAQDYLCVFAS